MRRVLMVALLLAVTTGLSACSSASPTASPTSGSSRTAGCGASTEADPVEVASTIGQRGEADFAAVFAGARVGDEGVEVYRKASAELDTWILTTFASACVVLRDAKFSAAELAKRYQQVGDDNAHWAGQGVEVNSVSSDFVRGVVVVGVTDAEKAKPLFAARYGDGVPVELVTEAPA